MKNKLQIGGVLAAVAAGALFSSATLAHEAGKANDSYVGATGHHHITDSSGNCVRTGSWKKEDMTVDCGAEPVVEVKKAPPPPPPPAPPAEPVYETVSLSAGALFDTNKSDLKAEGQSQLDALASKIGGNAKVTDVKIIGHTDSMGAESYNQQLSVRRATTVRDYLASKGVDSSLMSISGMGESSPVADNKTREGRAKNRRVEVSIGVSQQVK
ncbi:MAG: OmpA family protein [Gammaproteobacteria bacterium]|nr:OmpA family protein [Gammaproteobacteria bacterium]